MAKTKAKMKGKPASKAKLVAKKKPLPAKASAAKGKKTAAKPAKVKPTVRAGAAKKKTAIVKKSAAKTKAKAPVQKAPVAKAKAAKGKKVVAPIKPSKTAPTQKVVAVAKGKPVQPAPSSKAPVAPIKQAAPAKVAAAPAKPMAPPAAKADDKKKATVVANKPKEPVVAVMTGLEPLGAPARAAKKPMKERYVMEFYMNATPGSLYDLLCSPSGLSEWFCDDADVRGDQFTFRWGNDSQVAQCLSRKFGELMRFQWESDEDPGSYFELRIRVDTMTNETCLVVTDHAWPKDLEEGKALWESQIHTLQRMLGA